MAVDRTLLKQTGLFHLSPGDGGDEVPMRGMALERLRDSFSPVAGVFRETRGDAVSFLHPGSALFGSASPRNPGH